MATGEADRPIDYASRFIRVSLKRFLADATSFVRSKPGQWYDLEA